MRRRNNRGIGKLTLLVFGLLLAAIVYSAYRILPFYYYYFELVNHMEQVIKVASTETDQELRKKIVYHMKKMQIPASPEELKIVRDGNHMLISLKYEEIFYLTFRGKDYDIYKFKFDARAEGDF